MDECSGFMIPNHNNSSLNYPPCPPPAMLHSDGHLFFDDADGDGDSLARFPCPFCYIDIGIPSLSMHLQEEHCFDVINAVCPLCAENLGRDMIGHFLVHHSHLVKRRKNHKSGFWRNSLAVPGNDLQELTSFLRVTPATGRAGDPNSLADPKLSTFLSFQNPTSEQEANHNSGASLLSDSSEVYRKEMAMNTEETGPEQEEKIRRVVFFHGLIWSTIF